MNVSYNIILTTVAQLDEDEQFELDMPYTKSKRGVVTCITAKGHTRSLEQVGRYLKKDGTPGERWLRQFIWDPSVDPSPLCGQVREIHRAKLAALGIS